MVKISTIIKSVKNIKPYIEITTYRRIGVPEKAELLKQTPIVQTWRLYSWSYPVIKTLKSRDVLSYEVGISSKNSISKSLPFGVADSDTYNEDDYETSPSLVTDDEFMGLFGESHQRTSIESLVDAVGALDDFIIRLPEEDSERFRARMSMKLSRIHRLSNLIGDEYALF